MLSLVTPLETLNVCDEEGPVDKVTIEGEVAITTAKTTSSMSWKLWGFPTVSLEAVASLGWGLAHKYSLSSVISGKDPVLKAVA